MPNFCCVTLQAELYTCVVLLLRHSRGVSATKTTSTFATIVLMLMMQDVADDGSSDGHYEYDY
eukprot:3318760-Pyramimonas_sp.AAC.1